MKEALYRQYRPQRFAEVVGQTVVKNVLKQALKLGKVSHAYLFSGPRGVGKTTVARILAKALNCQGLKDGEPDLVCQNCQLAKAGRFLDLVEIDAASYTGVDHVRELIDHLKFAPTLGEYKVFIIDEVHMLSKAAFNALLKSLEEPPAHVIFVLATTEVHKVPATIISRCQRFDFSYLSPLDILKYLKKILRDFQFSLPEEALNLLVQASGGSLRDSLSILDQLLSLGKTSLNLDEAEEILGLVRVETAQNFLELIIRKDHKNAVKFVKELSTAGRDLVQFLRTVLEYLKILLFVKLGVEESRNFGLSLSEQPILLRQAEILSLPELLQILKAFLGAFREMPRTPLPELPLLSELLSLSSLREEKNLEDPPSGLEDQTPLNLGNILAKWHEVLAKLKEYNQSLVGSLRLAKLARVQGLLLTLVFPYNFQKETFAAAKNKVVVEQVLEGIFEKPLKIEVVLEGELKEFAEGPFSQQSKTPGEDLMEEALKVLGKQEI